MTFTAEGSGRDSSIRMIQEYYRQMRKFGCNILAVVQQYNIIDDMIRSYLVPLQRYLSP
jgi:hypothetical protein